MATETSVPVSQDVFSNAETLLENDVSSTSSQELLSRIRKEYQEKALELSPMDEREVKSFTVLHEIYRGDETFISRESAGEIYDYLKIFAHEKEECLSKLPPQVDLEQFLSFRREQLSKRIYREKLRQLYTNLSDDGVNLDYDKLLDAINNEESENERIQNEKIVLNAFFYKVTPPVITRPLDDKGDKYPIKLSIDTLIKNYFMD